MKPTPEEKCPDCDGNGWYFEGSEEQPAQVQCRNCNATGWVKKPSTKEYVHDLMFKKLPIKPSPSPEARVDWEGEAAELINILPHIDCCGGDMCDEDFSMKEREQQAVEMIAKALSNAFEKGRKHRD
jgi:hypothetical protein